MNRRAAEPATPGAVRRGGRHRALVAIPPAAPRRRRAAPGLLLTAAAALALTGCGTTTVPATFYRLGTLPASERAPGEVVAPVVPHVLVGPVRVPDYLDRPQLVRRSGPYELAVDEFHRWGGSLREELSLALVENLNGLLGPGSVAVSGDGALFEDALQLRVDLQRLEGGPDGVVELVARWTLLEDGGRRALVSRRSRVTVPVGGDGAVALVAAYSDAVAVFSRELADALRAPLR